MLMQVWLRQNRTVSLHNIKYPAVSQANLVLDSDGSIGHSFTACSTMERNPVRENGQ